MSQNISCCSNNDVVSAVFSICLFLLQFGFPTFGKICTCVEDQIDTACMLPVEQQMKNQEMRRVKNINTRHVVTHTWPLCALIAFVPQGLVSEQSQANDVYHLMSTLRKCHLVLWPHFQFTCLYKIFKFYLFLIVKTMPSHYLKHGGHYILVSCCKVTNYYKHSDNTSLLP